MTLTTEKNGNALTVRLSGELNTLTSQDFSALLDKELDGMQTLILDFAECDYVSSAGLRLLLGTCKKLKAINGKMELINVGENFMDVLENTGLDAVFGVC